jgi:hypothetical protein
VNPVSILKQFCGEISWKVALGCLTGRWDYLIMSLVGESSGFRTFGPP